LATKRRSIVTVNLRRHWRADEAIMLGWYGRSRRTICRPFTGARFVLVEDAPGMAVSVNPVALMLNLT
jgi:hypothetical protein